MKKKIEIPQEKSKEYSTVREPKVTVKKTERMLHI